jgi:hypothetical protein
LAISNDLLHQALVLLLLARKLLVERSVKIIQTLRQAIADPLNTLL